MGFGLVLSWLWNLCLFYDHCLSSWCCDPLNPGSNPGTYPKLQANHTSKIGCQSVRTCATEWNWSGDNLMQSANRKGRWRERRKKGIDAVLFFQCFVLSCQSSSLHNKILLRSANAWSLTCVQLQQCKPLFFSLIEPQILLLSMVVPEVNAFSPPLRSNCCYYSQSPSHLSHSLFPPPK